MPQTLQSLAEFVSARLIGDGQVEVSRVASIASAQPGDLVFVESDKHLADALASQASAVIAGEFAAASGACEAAADRGQSATGVCDCCVVAARCSGVSTGDSRDGRHPSIRQGFAERQR